MATVILLLRGGDPIGPNLSLLGQYLLGYDVSWGGALVGLLEASLGGFAFGFVLGSVINRVVAAHERRFLVEAELENSMTGLDGIAR